MKQISTSPDQTTTDKVQLEFKEFLNQVIHLFQTQLHYQKEAGLPMNEERIVKTFSDSMRMVKGTQQIVAAVPCF